MAFHHNEGRYPFCRASPQIQNHPRRPVEGIIIQPHVSGRPGPSTQHTPTRPNYINPSAHNMLVSGILRLRALQSAFNPRAQPRRFSPFYPSLPPLFPFPPPHSPTRLNPPMMYTDYSTHLNLPAPPIDKVFQSACMWPRWWTTSVPPLDQSTIHSHPATPTLCLPPASTLLVESGTSDILHYGDVLNMYDTTGDLQQSLCISPALIGQQPLPQSSPLSSLRQPLPPAATAIEPFNFPPLPPPPGSYPALPFSDKEPPYSFSALAGLAIMSYPQKKATLNEIYSFIASTFPFYKRSQRAWKNSIRNCLYSSDCFMRPRDKGGKNVYWTINSRAKTHILKGSFKAKRQSVATSAKRRKKSAKQLDQESRGYFECINIVPIPNENTNIYDLFPPGAVKDAPTISVIQYDDVTRRDVTSGITK